MLNVTAQTIANMEARGRLHPQRDENGVYRHDPAEVRALLSRSMEPNKRRLRTRGELEADAFALLDQGKTRKELVCTLLITSEEAQHFWENWQTGFVAAAQKKDSDARLAERERHTKRMNEIFGSFTNKKSEGK
jgi:hypothetical protein